MGCKESICRNCFHSYVCEQFSENKDDNNTKCHFANDHYIPTADVVPKSEVEALQEMLDAAIAGQETLQKALINAKQEAAMEIFEEIMTEFRKHYSEYQEPKCKINKALHKANRLIVDTVWDILSELKKKHTEGKT